jgi:hypothetical protein
MILRRFNTQPPDVDEARRQGVTLRNIRPWNLHPDRDKMLIEIRANDAMRDSDYLWTARGPEPKRSIDRPRLARPLLTLAQMRELTGM